MTPGGYKLLGSVPNLAQEAQAIEINDHGAVVGEVGNVLLPSSTDSDGFVYLNGVMTALPPLTGDTEAIARGIDNSGEIVGVSTSAQGVSHAVMWLDGTAQELALPQGATGSVAYNINKAGTIIVGDAEVDGVIQAVEWVNGVPSVIDPSTSYSYVFDVNDSGVVIGNDANGGLVYQGGQLSHLTAPAGYRNPTVAGINDEGLIVGNAAATVSGLTDMVAWQNGQPVDVNRSANIPSGGDYQAISVDDQGEILVQGPGTGYVIEFGN